MGMGPDNQFHGLSKELADEMTKPRYDKEGLTVFNVGEHIELRNYIFVVNKIDNLSKPNRLVLVPVGPVKSASQVEALNRLEDIATKIG